MLLIDPSFSTFLSWLAEHIFIILKLQVMRKHLLPSLFLAAASFLLSCNGSGLSTADNSEEAATVTDSTAIPDHAAPAALPGDISDLTPEQIVTRMFQAIQKKDLKGAHAFWSNAPAGYEEFADAYKNARDVKLTITGETFTAAAAGTAYATVPVTVAITLNNGEKQELKGHYQLTSSNNPESPSRGWRIASQELKDANMPESGASEEEMVKYIRKEFQAINNAGYKPQTHKIDCGEITYFTVGNDVRKVKKSWFAGDYGGDEEYYFKNGQLFFAYFWDEGGPANGKVTRQECRYYFFDEELIRTLPKGPRTCMDGAEVLKFASDVMVAFMKQDYSGVECF